MKIDVLEDVKQYGEKTETIRLEKQYQQALMHIDLLKEDLNGKQEE